MSEEEWTRKRLKKFFKDTGMSQTAFAEYVGVSVSAFSRWLKPDGILPTQVRTTSRLDKAWVRWQKDPETTTVEEETAEAETAEEELSEQAEVVKPPKDPTLTQDAIRAMWKASGLPQGEFAQKLGVSLSAFSHWCTGAHLPVGKNREKLIHWLKHQPLTPRDKNDLTVGEPPERRRKQRAIAVESVMEVTTKFQHKYRLAHDRRYSNDILLELEQETGVPRRTLRLIICVWAALMKNRYDTLEDAFNVISGSESGD